VSGVSPDDVLMPSTAAALAGVQLITLADLADAGLLRVADTAAVRVRRYRRGDVEAFLAACRDTAKEARP
jgi:hypothetical protein